MKSIGKAFNNATNFASTVINRREGLSPKVLDILSKKGDAVINSIKIGRTPVQAFITGVIKVVSTTPYDTLFHLFIIMDTNKGQILLEKNAVINMDISPNIPGAEYMEVPNVPQGMTISQLVDNTAAQMGQKFIPYSPSGNNCQDFIYNVLTANGMSDPTVLDFVKQDTKSIFASPTFRKFARTITNLGGSFDVLLQGGSMHHKSNELNNIEISQLMHHYHIPYHGCYIKNKLPVRLLNGAYIINLNGASHWTGLIKDGDSYYYFDSFGFPAPEEIEDRIGDYTWSNEDIQSLMSSSCGWFVMAWIKHMLKKDNKKLAYANFLKLFNDKHLMNNESVLSALFH